MKPLAPPQQTREHRTTQQPCTHRTLTNRSNPSMDARIVNLKSLFSSPIVYRIPQFQRPYAWGESEQWMPLWEDVRAIADQGMNIENSEIKSHFLGAIVLQNLDAKVGVVTRTLVVDGQQRLTTLQLLIKAAQWAFQGENEIDRAERLRLLIRNDDNHLGDDPNNRTKIRQANSLDHLAFREAMNDQEASNSIQRIPRAYEFFKQKIESWLTTEEGTVADKCNALEATLSQHLEIAAIDLDKDEKPHIIFETLNARGEPLKQSDLVKNTVMYEANVIDDGEAANRLWAMFDGPWWRHPTGEKHVDRIQLDRFLSYWMVVQIRKEVAHQRVAAEFRQHVGNEKTTDIDIITKNLREVGVVYKNILEVRDSDKEIKRFLKVIHILDIGSAMPVLLWLKTSGLTDEQLKLCFEIFESYLVRRMLYSLGSQGLSRFFVVLLGKLHQKPPSDCFQIMIEHLASSTLTGMMWPNDRVLIERFLTRPLAGTIARRKMVLEAIEEHMRGPKTEPLIDTTQLTIEHVMPKKWEEHWPIRKSPVSQEDIELRRDAINFLGNLTLVTGKLNTSLSNGPWSEKSKELEKHATLLLTKNLLSDYSHHFDEKAIKKRTQEMANMIFKIWPPSNHYEKLIR